MRSRAVDDGHSLALGQREVNVLLWREVIQSHHLKVFMGRFQGLQNGRDQRKKLADSFSYVSTYSHSLQLQHAGNTVRSAMYICTHNSLLWASWNWPLQRGDCILYMRYMYVCMYVRMYTAIPSAVSMLLLLGAGEVGCYR